MLRSSNIEAIRVSILQVGRGLKAEERGNGNERKTEMREIDATSRTYLITCISWIVRGKGSLVRLYTTALLPIARTYV
jgi:hypothetical protein